MVEQAWYYGCLFCRTCAEGDIEAYINQSVEAIEAVAPMRTRSKTVAGKVLKIKRLCCPGMFSFVC